MVKMYFEFYWIKDQNVDHNSFIIVVMIWLLTLWNAKRKTNACDVTKTVWPPLTSISSSMTKPGNDANPKIWWIAGVFWFFLEDYIIA